jgi:glycerol-3-phosphate acyltransferase PlsY
VSYILAILAILFAYLCGSIPVGYLVARLYGVNLTASGSGKTGGTNVLRSVGGVAAGLTVFGDIFKSLIPVYILTFVAQPLVVALAATAAVLGHNRSIFLRFRGGVGAVLPLSRGGCLFIAHNCRACGLLLWPLAVMPRSFRNHCGFDLDSFDYFSLPRLYPYEYIVFGVLNLLVMFMLCAKTSPSYGGTERKIGQKLEISSRFPHPSLSVEGKIADEFPFLLNDDRTTAVVAVSTFRQIIFLKISIY